MIYIAARVRAALVRIMRSDGSLPRGAYKQNWAQQGRSWAPRAAMRARTRVQNRPQAFSATIWKLSQTKLRYADVISYLSPGQKKKKRRKNPLFLPPNSADQWHLSPPSSWVLQHALKPSHSQQQGPDGGSWSKGTALPAALFQGMQRHGSSMGRCSHGSCSLPSFTAQFQEVISQAGKTLGYSSNLYLSSAEPSGSEIVTVCWTNCVELLNKGIFSHLAIHNRGPIRASVQSWDL